MKTLKNISILIILFSSVYVYGLEVIELAHVLKKNISLKKNYVKTDSEEVFVLTHSYYRTR